MKDLNELREEIDRIDNELVRLFEERMNVVVQVAEYKRANNLSVLNSGREQIVLDKCCGFLKNKDLREALTEWMKQTMALSRQEQEKYLKSR